MSCNHQIGDGKDEAKTMSRIEEDENLNQSSSDGEFSDPLCVDVPTTEGDDSPPARQQHDDEQ